jgi:subtilisin family serine protease
MDSHESSSRENWMRLVNLCGVAFLATFVIAGAAMPGIDHRAPGAGSTGTAVVSYSSEGALQRALQRHPARVVRRIPALGVAELRPAGDLASYALALADEPGIARVERTSARRSKAEPGLAVSPEAAFQWQYAATHSDQVPEAVSRASGAITIAVIDTGADLAAPDLAAKTPLTYSVRTRSSAISDPNGHGTFVASLAAGSNSNGDGIAGGSGDARLMVIEAADRQGSFTDVDEAAAIVYAVDHGAKIINLSLGGPTTSTTERRAVDYAVAKGALLVAAIGNSHANGNPVEYPAALLQPVGSRGVGGRGLSVGASTKSGARAGFSGTGTHISLAAPGENVFGAVSSASSESRYPRVSLPGSATGFYGYASGTSFAAPQVAGAAALVWAANPQLRADEVASILEQTASGRGSWSPELGFGVLDVAAAVARAQQQPATAAPLKLDGKRAGSRVALSWPSLSGAVTYRIAVAQNGGAERVLARPTTRTTASYSLVTGRTYSFTVAALDTNGTPLAVSTPWTVSVPRGR